MLFSSMIFLWCFLPLTLLIYWLIPSIPAKNVVLLIASLIFYAWGEPKYILLMLMVVAINYVAALLVSALKQKKAAVLVLVGGVAANLLVLFYFKYFDFFAHTMNRIIGHEAIGIRNIILPLGISFYTFQAMSYLVDVYRKDTGAQKNYFKLLLYVSMFPQLIAGPIVRYRDVADEITARRINWDDCAYGFKRFAYGLGKKVLLSNTLAYYTDILIDMPSQELSTGVHWLAAILYTLQIYYDFSGYSDMAIGLGRMLGFHFLENFNYPYVSQSIREFWRRWHISLSTWFREYVYIPLGGNRKGKVRTYLHLLAVFFLTGLWHGASFAFVFWGLYHGFFMLLERFALGRLLEKNRLRFLNHIYTLVVVIVGWVFFRIESLSDGLRFVAHMFTYHQGIYGLSDIWSIKLIIVLVIAIILCGPVQHLFPKLKESILSDQKISAGAIVLLVVIMLICFMNLVSGSYNPFIYFRF